MYGWTWAPTSDDPSNAGYFTSTSGGNTQAVWNESWGPIGTGGGASAIYPRPSWQAGADAGYGNHRIVPDTSWNAAVNGGVDVYITAFPEFNCGNSTGCWTFYGGTSAASPQTAALVALSNAARSAAGKSPIASSTRSCTAASARRPRTPTWCPCTSAAPRRRSPDPMSA
jgi:subtilase family serine protease